MSRFVLKHDVDLTLWGRTFTVPKGSGCRLEAGRYAIADKTLLVRLTGNSSAPFSQFAFVPDDAVFEVPFTPIKRTPTKRYRS